MLWLSSLENYYKFHSKSGKYSSHELLYKDVPCMGHFAPLATPGISVENSSVFPVQI